ncbi:MAG: hypothetical protein WDW38_006107 [Sanguina aurantia]
MCGAGRDLLGIRRPRVCAAPLPGRAIVRGVTEGEEAGEVERSWGLEVDVREPVTGCWGCSRAGQGRSGMGCVRVCSQLEGAAFGRVGRVQNECEGAVPARHGHVCVWEGEGVWEALCGAAATQIGESSSGSGIERMAGS